STVTGDTIPAHEAFVVIDKVAGKIVDKTLRPTAETSRYYIIYLANDQLSIAAPNVGVLSQEDDRGNGDVDPEDIHNLYWVPRISRILGTEQAETPAALAARIFLRSGSLNAYVFNEYLQDFVTELGGAPLHEQAVAQAIDWHHVALPSIFFQFT